MFVADSTKAGPRSAELGPICAKCGAISADAGRRDDIHSGMLAVMGRRAPASSRAPQSKLGRNQPIKFCQIESKPNQILSNPPHMWSKRTQTRTISAQAWPGPAQIWFRSNQCCSKPTKIWPRVAHAWPNTDPELVDINLNVVGIKSSLSPPHQRPRGGHKGTKHRWGFTGRRPLRNGSEDDDEGRATGRGEPASLHAPQPRLWLNFFSRVDAAPGAAVVSVARQFSVMLAGWPHKTIGPSGSSAGGGRGALWAALS